MPTTLTRRALLGALPALAIPNGAVSFRDQVGINTHLESPPYDRDPASLLGVIQRLGIRHLRDELRPGNDWPRWRALAQAAGLRFTLLVSPATNTPAEMLDALAALGVEHVAAIEGQNEGDSDWFRRQPAAHGSWVDAVLSHHRATAEALRRAGLRIPLLSPTVLDYKPEDMALLRPAAPDCDAIAVHAYAQHLEQPETEAPFAGLRWYKREVAGRFDPNAPVMITECGYPTAADGLPPDLVARYLPRLLLESAAFGIRRTYLYELLDEGGDRSDTEQHWGLLGPDLRPKPAFETVSVLLAELGNRALTAQKVSVTSPATDLRAYAFGDFVALWRAAPSWDPRRRRRISVAPAPVTLGQPILRTLLLAPGETWKPATRQTLSIDDTVSLVTLPRAPLGTARS